MKKTTTFSFYLLLMCALLGTSHVWAQEPGDTQYVSDVLYVPLRSGMGNQYRVVHRGLRSGTSVELIRTDEDAGGESWSLVSAENGDEGWVRSQFLVDQPTSAQQLVGARNRLENLSQETETLEGTISDLRQENNRLTQALEQLREEHQTLQEENEEIVAVSSDALNLHEQHQELNHAYQLLQTRADVLQAENEQLKQDRRYHDWMVGGGILFSGVILSLILQAIGKRRRKSEWG